MTTLPGSTFQNSALRFTKHGVILAATILNSHEAIKMSVFVVRAFFQMHEQLFANTAVLKRLAEIDKTLLDQDRSRGIIWQRIQPLLTLPPSEAINMRIVAK